MSEQPRVYILHENPDWLPPFTAAFEAEGVPAEEILLTAGSIDLDAEPAPGVYWSRMSASAHTRGNIHSKDFTRAYLRWLEQSDVLAAAAVHAAIERRWRGPVVVRWPAYWP